MLYRKIRALFLFNKLDQTDKKRILYLERCFQTKIYDPGNYLRALRHRSKLVDHAWGSTESYERLEFLGDSVLDLIVTEIVFDRFPEDNEGFMTQLRSKLVKGDALAGYSLQMGLPQYIEIGDRAKGQGIEYSVSILGDIFEALVGALYHDRGYRVTRTFIQRVIDEYLNIQELASMEDNYKSILMEYAQARRMRIPTYKVIAEHGPAHNRTFEVEVCISDAQVGRGSGRSKKLAEQDAARNAYDSIRKKEMVGSS